MISLNHEITSPTIFFGQAHYCHRPYWDLVQGSILGAAVDTVGAGYSRSLGRVSGMLESGYHHYSIEQDQAIADSFYGKFSLEYHFPSLPERMETSVFYYLDAEYFDGEPRTLLSLDGTARYEPLPLSSREAHVGGVRMGYRLPLDVAADGYAGFSRDRLGGSGPITGASLSYDFSDDVRFGVRGDYAHVSLAGGGEGLRSVVFGEVRF